MHAVPAACAAQAFDDLDGMLEGPEGFDLSRSVWKQSGWREVDALRRKLENLRRAPLRCAVVWCALLTRLGNLPRAPSAMFFYEATQTCSARLSWRQSAAAPAVGVLQGAAGPGAQPGAGRRQGPHEEGAGGGECVEGMGQAAQGASLVQPHGGVLPRFEHLTTL